MEKIWLKSYPEYVPAEINTHRYSSLVEIFNKNCDLFQDKNAFVSFGDSLRYSTLKELSKNFAAFLQKSLKLKKGARIAIMLPNLFQYPVSLFGSLMAGLIVVNVNPLYTPRELIYQLNDAGVEAIVVLANFAHVLEKALPSTKIKHVIVTEVGDLLHFPKRVFFNFVAKHIKKVVKPFKIPEAIIFRKALAKGRQQVLETVELTQNDIALLQYTGGTTGIAKGAMLSHGNLIANVLQCSAWIDGILEKGKEVIVAALPLYHIFSLTICCFVFLALGGSSILIANPRNIQKLIKELSSIPFTIFAGVNTLYNALLEHPAFGKLNFSSLKIAIAGGMAVQTNVAERWQAATNTCIIEGYGLTETSPVISVNPLNLKKFKHSIGLPLPSTLISIRDNDHEVMIGQPGELCVKGPQVMKSYWQEPEETKKVFSEEGWLRTGDIVTMDKDGFLYLVDRKKDIILVSGFNVYPNEVESVIGSYPGVADVAVIGIPHSHSGETVKAFIVKRDLALTKDNIMKYCKENLTGYKLPSEIEFVTELPKSSIGKVLRRELRDKGKSYDDIAR